MHLGSAKELVSIMNSGNAPSFTIAAFAAGLGIGVALGNVMGGIGRKESGARKSAGKRELAKKMDMVLHVYDHCPFCVRVELVLGWLGLPFKRVVHGYGEFDELTNKFGKKLCPVLEYTELETGKRKFMHESLDIIAFLDGLEGPAHCSFPPASSRLSQWIDNDYKPPLRLLARPRLLKLPAVIRDFATEKDRAYAKSKYEGQGFDYAKAEAQFDSAKADVEAALIKLDTLLASSEACNSYGLSMDDIILLPELRTLTVVKGVKWPTKAENYLKLNLARANVNSYAPFAV